MGSCVRIAKQDSNQPIINASLSRQIPSFSPVQGLHNNNIDLGKRTILIYAILI